MKEKTASTVNWRMICHLGGLALYVGIPLGNILVPLLIWGIKREGDPGLDKEGREVLNFNLSYTIYGVVAGLSMFVLVGFVLLPAILIAHIVLVIRAALKSNSGEAVKYPYVLQFFNPPA